MNIDHLTKNAFNEHQKKVLAEWEKKQQKIERRETIDRIFKKIKNCRERLRKHEQGTS